MATRIVPGPRPAPLVGNLLQFRRDRLGFLRAAAAHGDAVRLRLGPWPMLLLAHPDHVHAVLTAHQHVFRKGPVLQRARVVLGDGLLTSEGDDHRRQRRVANAAFTRQRIDGYAQVMAAAADRAFAAWTPGEPVDVHRTTVRATLAVAGSTLLGTGLDADVDAVEGAVADILSAYQLALLPFGHRLQQLPLPPVRRLRRGRATLHALVARMIAEHRADPDGYDDLLATLLAGAAEGTLSDDDVRDQAVTFLLAGHETTANALAFACHLLATHPAAQDRLHAEAAALDLPGGDLPGNDLPGAGHVEGLAYARAVLAEALRLYPPSWTMGREAVEPVDVGGVAVAPGEVVLLSQWVVHRDRRWWDEPEAFRPERWLDGARPRRGTYFPFGGGRRQCIGESFAWTEGVLALTVLARRWRLAPSAGAPVLEPLITLRPAAGVWVVPEPVSPAGDAGP
jgi:cytochrome P450